MSREALDDSVAIDDLAETTAHSSRYGRVKVIIALFFIFMLVCSDIFQNNVLSGFKGAVKGRSPTTSGVVIMGIFLVIFYALALYMFDQKVL